MNNVNAENDKILVTILNYLTLHQQYLSLAGEFREIENC